MKNLNFKNCYFRQFNHIYEIIECVGRVTVVVAKLEPTCRVQDLNELISFLFTVYKFHQSENIAESLSFMLAGYNFQYSADLD